jgi:hypothetical protein
MLFCGPGKRELPLASQPTSQNLSSARRKEEVLTTDGVHEFSGRPCDAGTNLTALGLTGFFGFGTTQTIRSFPETGYVAEMTAPGH